jgi:hypothetical protein
MARTADNKEAAYKKQAAKGFSIVENLFKGAWSILNLTYADSDSK